MEVSKSNAGLLNPLFQATQLGGGRGGIDRGTRVATCTTRRYMDSPDGRCQVWQGSARWVCVRGKGGGAGPAHTHIHACPPCPCHPEREGPREGEIRQRDAERPVQPSSAQRPSPLPTRKERRPVAFPLQWLGRVVDCLVRQGRCDSVAVRTHHWPLHLKCGCRLPPWSRFFHAPVPRLI